MACEICRLRKVKCDRTRPRCRNCSLRSMACVYRGERIRRTQLNGSSEGTWQRAVGISSTLSIPATYVGGNPHFNAEKGQLSPKSIERPEETDHSAGPTATQHSNRPREGTHTLSDRAQPPYALSTQLRDHTSSESQMSCTLLPAGQLLRDQFHADNRFVASQERSPLDWSWTCKGDEYTGPSSGVSSLSNKYLKWAQTKTGRFDQLCDIFAGLRDGVAKNLYYPKCVKQAASDNFHQGGSEITLPDEDTVWRYTRAYFSQVQIIYPILDRKDFEAQLANFLAGQSGSSSGWKALLFAVVASGCRAALSSESTKDFLKSSQEAWSYFLCALEHEKMLMYEPTDLTSVKALAVMTVFVQGFSSPLRLEFTLCSTAARLVQGLGLQCALPAGRQATDAEIEERNRLFWVVYCLDKTIALRGGRPCIIDDAELTCELPRVHFYQADEQLQGSEHVDDIFQCFIRFARLCGQISSTLYSTNALRLRFRELQEPTTIILAELKAWRKLFAPNAVENGTFRENQTLSGRRRIGLLILHLSYYYALCAVHRRFNPMFCHGDEEEVDSDELLVEASSMAHVDAARAMILLTKHLEIESHSPCWLLVYYPLTAVLSIFTHAVSQPSRAFLESDVFLLDIAAGLFGRLEYVTSGMVGLRKISDLIRFACLMVDEQTTSAIDISSRQPDNPPGRSCPDNREPASHPSPRNEAQSASRLHDDSSNTLTCVTVTPSGPDTPNANGCSDMAMRRDLVDGSTIFSANFEAEFFVQNSSAWPLNDCQLDNAFEDTGLVLSGYPHLTSTNLDYSNAYSFESLDTTQGRNL